MQDVPSSGSSKSKQSQLLLDVKKQKWYAFALGQYLGKTDPDSIKGDFASLEDRVVRLEQKLARLGRLAD